MYSCMWSYSENNFANEALLEKFSCFPSERDHEHRDWAKPFSNETHLVNNQELVFPWQAEHFCTCSGDPEHLYWVMCLKGGTPYTKKLLLPGIATVAYRHVCIRYMYILYNVNNVLYMLSIQRTGRAGNGWKVKCTVYWSSLSNPKLQLGFGPTCPAFLCVWERIFAYLFKGPPPLERNVKY